jgi:hypothetical protein
LESFEKCDDKIQHKVTVVLEASSAPKRMENSIGTTVNLIKQNWRIKPARRMRTGFHKFSKKISCIAHAWRGHAGLTVYPPRIQMGDVASHRKSKFGPRQGIKLT